MTSTGGRTLSVVVAALAAYLAFGIQDAAAQQREINNPISSFFNAIFGGGQGDARRQQPRRERDYRRSRPSKPSRSSTRRNRSSHASQQRSSSSRPSRSAAVEKNAEAMRVVVFGDQLAEGLAAGLEEAFEDNPDVVIVEAAEEKNGLVGQGPEAWPQKVKAYLANPENKVDAVVVMIGANDRTAIHQGAEEIPFGTERWRDHYAQRAENMMEFFMAKGKPLYWVGLPPVEDGEMSRDFAFFNEIFRARSYRSGTQFIDIWNGFVDEDNAYAQSGPDVKGEIRELRSDDGVGFTKAGDRKLAHFVARELRRDFVQDGEFVASLPEMPDPPDPYRPSEEMLQTGRGEIVNLSTPPRNGGLLAGGMDEQPDPPEDSAYYRVMMQGEAPKPEPGRSDDFSWPPQESAGG